MPDDNQGAGASRMRKLQSRGGSSRRNSRVSSSKRWRSSLLPLRSDCRTYRASPSNMPPPVRAGGTPRAIPADVHHRTFIAAFAAVLEHGMGSAPDICKIHVALSKPELQAALTQLQSYLRTHYLANSSYPDHVSGTPSCPPSPRGSTSTCTPSLNNLTACAANTPTRTLPPAPVHPRRTRFSRG